MTNLIILEIATIILFFFIKIVVFYLLIKALNREIRFLTALKPLLLYELAILIFLFIDPAKLVYSLRMAVSHVFLVPIYLLILVIVSFLIFRFIMKKFSLLDFKKSLAVFLLIFFVANPILSFYRATLLTDLAERILTPSEWSELSHNLEMMVRITSLRGLPLSLKVFKVVSDTGRTLFGNEFFYELNMFRINIR